MGPESRRVNGHGVCVLYANKYMQSLKVCAMLRRLADAETPQLDARQTCVPARLHMTFGPRARARTALTL